MAWTTPTTRTTGDLITAAIWNSDLVDNLAYLKTETDKVGALLREGAETAVNNTTVETTVFSGAVPANTLSTNKILIGRLWYRWDSTAAANSFTLRVKYGGTTLFSVAPGAAQTNVSQGYGFLEFILRGDGATNAQEARAQHVFQYNANSPVWLPNISGTAAIDSTAAQNLVITVQHAATDASTTFTTKGIVIEGAF